MSEQMQLWLDRNARLPGVLAHALLRAQGGCADKNWQEQTRCASVEESLRAIASLAMHSDLLDSQARLVELLFDTAWIFGAVGVDGCWMFILMSREAAKSEVADVRKLAHDFLALAGADHYE